MEKNLRERFPSVQRINSMINKRKPMICLVCYATLNDGYYLFGCSGWIKVRGKWRTYYPSGVYQSKKDSPKEGLQVRYCGCCGDVNTWYCKDGDEVSEYFYVY